MPAISVSAPGKMILCGEHAVVYRQPAIAIPVAQVQTTTKVFARPTAPQGEIIVKADAIGIDGPMHDLPETFPIHAALNLIKAHFSIASFPACEIRISSTIPIAAGLGSSASVSVSLLNALSLFLGHPLATNEVNRLAFEVEKLHHGNPSGVDNTVIAYNRPVYYVRGETLEFVENAAPLHFIVANTGVGASTAEAVEKVRQNWQKDQAAYEGYFAEIGQISKKIREHLLKVETREIGALLTRNHALLQSMQVSCTELDTLVEAALNAGALGAKLSGGGLGGNMLALVEPERSDFVNEALKAAGAVSTIETTLPASK